MKDVTRALEEESYQEYVYLHYAGVTTPSPSIRVKEDTSRKVLHTRYLAFSSLQFKLEYLPFGPNCCKE